MTTIVFVRHFKNEIPLTIDHGREMSTISGNVSIHAMHSVSKEVNGL